MLRLKSSLAQRRNPFVAFVLTFFEAILTLLMVRMVYRAIKKLVMRITGRQPPSALLGDKEPVTGYSD